MLVEHEPGVRHLFPKAFEVIHNEQDSTSDCDCLGIYSVSDICVAELEGVGFVPHLAFEHDQITEPSPMKERKAS